jgi:hypothetical protein
MSTSLQLERRTERLMRQAIGKLLAVRISAGESTQGLRKFVSACLDDAIVNRKRHVAQVSVDVHELASILRTWHSETRFLSPDGKPKPLPFEGRDGLKALIQVHYPRRKSKDVLHTFVRSKLVRKKRNGDWVPTERHARIPLPTPELLLHFAESVARLVETVSRNTTSRNKRDLLFERAAKVPRLPVKELDAFRKYVQAQSIAFISAIDDWLESRSLSKDIVGRRTVPAGVHTFAFIEKPNRRLKTRKQKTMRARLKTSATHPSTPASKSSPRSSSATRS